MLVTPVARLLTSLICASKNNGDKFYRRKFVLAVDEKLIINKLGPNISVTFGISKFNSIVNSFTHIMFIEYLSYFL